MKQVYFSSEKIAFPTDPPFTVEFPLPETKVNFSFKEVPVMGLAIIILEKVGLLLFYFVKGVATTVRDLPGSYGAFYRKLLYEARVDVFTAVGMIPLELATFYSRIFCNIVNKTLYPLLQDLQIKEVQPLLKRVPEADQIDLHHLQSFDTDLVFKGLPEDFDWEKELLAILDLWEKAKDSQNPYFLQNCRGMRREKIKKNIQEFIYKVKNRIAFLGTPPSNQPKLLEKFYSQIEKMVLFSVWKSRKALEEFYQNAGQDLPTYTEDQRRKHRNLCEDQTIIVVELAQAEEHCGARYMGHALNLYRMFSQGEVKEQTLEEQIYQCLAEKRREIAEKHANQYAKSDTHIYSAYFANLGKLLAIPGTKGVVEYLFNDMDTSTWIVKFFQEYTVDCLIETIQEQFKKSEAFRESIYQWIGDHLEGWNLEIYLEQIEEIVLQVNFAGFQQDKNLLQAVDLIQKNREIAQQTLQDLREAESFESSFFSEKQVKQAFFTQDELTQAAQEVQKGSSLSLEMAKVIATRKKIQELGKAISPERLGESLYQSLLQKIQKKENITPQELISMETQVNALQKQLAEKGVSFEVATVKGILQQEDQGQALRNKLQGYFQQIKKADFLTQVFLQDQKQGDLPSILLEWLLVSHKVLLPRRN